MNCCDRVPIIDVNSKTFSSIWPSLKFAIKSSVFIAVDLELSGLGSRKLINAKLVEDRYNAISEVAKSHAVVALGLSCFSHKSPDSDSTAVSFRVQTFNILTLCQESYTVEPEALKFLIKHGFDFNKQYSAGLPYYRGNDRENDCDQQPLRDMVADLFASKKPLVFHNGLVDLIFLYHNFYCELPSKFSSFLADLSEMCPEGVYDTKYIAADSTSMEASYLEYVFRKRQRENARKEQNGKAHIVVDFLPYKETADVFFQHFNLRTEINTSSTICKSYAHFGWCGANSEKRCKNSHDIDDILDAEKTSKNKKCKVNDVAMEVSSPADKSFSACHRAGQDAFMTGFAFASFLTPHWQGLSQVKGPGLQQLKNKIYLSGKNVPLLIMTSHFAKTSTAHATKRHKLESLE